MLLIKVNEFKYQVLKVGKNNVTIPYEEQTTIPLYKTDEEISSKYVGVDETEAYVLKYLNMAEIIVDDYLVSFDVFVNADDSFSTSLFEMQATEEQTQAAIESEDTAMTSVEDVLERVKVNDEERVNALNLMLKVTSDKNQIREITTLRDYLKSNVLKKKLIERKNGGKPELKAGLLDKYNAIICYITEVEELLLDTSLKQAEREMIIDYIYVSKYKIGLFKKEFTRTAPVGDNDYELIVKFTHVANELFGKLKYNPTKITKSLEFIANTLNAINRMTKSQHFDRSLLLTCTDSAQKHLKIVNEAIEEEFSVINKVAKGDK